MQLNAEQITISYGSREILHAVNFTAQAGEVTAIVGPNGCGKTTLLRALTGESDYSGTVTLNGHDIATAKPWNLAAIRAVLPPSHAACLPFHRGRGGAAWFEPRQIGGNEWLIGQALYRVGGLNGFEGRFYQELSGGRATACATGACSGPGLDCARRWRAALAVSGRTCVGA